MSEVLYAVIPNRAQISFLTGLLVRAETGLGLFGDCPYRSRSGQIPICPGWW
jgi:hypothetical protein